MKKMMLYIMCAVCIVGIAASCSAADTVGSIVLIDTLYGTATGAIVGAAIMAFTSHPSDNLEYIGYGAATGAIAGMLFGVYEAMAFVEYDGGTVKIAMPTITTSSDKLSGYNSYSRMDILHIHF